MENNQTARAIFQTLLAGPRRPNAGCLALICGAHSRNGTSYIARSVAFAAAEHFTPLGERVLLLDYDLYKQSQLEAVMATGAIHGPYDASFGVTPFWQVRAGILEDSPEIPAAAFASLYIQDQLGLAVSVFRWDQVGTNQSLRLITSPEYWAQLRQHFAMIIVDAPAIDRSNSSAILYPYMDTCAIAALPQNVSSAQTLQMRRDIEIVGGHCSGLIVNEAFGASA